MRSDGGNPLLVWNNPVYRKEMKTRWRGWRLVWAPIVILMILTPVCGIGLISALFAQHELQRLFTEIGGLAAHVAGLAAWLLPPALTATGLAVERKQLTLESLLITRLRTAEIVCGKLVGGLVPSLLALVPAWLLALTLYGASLNPAVLPKAIETLIELPSVLFALACTSVLVSAFARGPGGAVAAAYLGVPLLFVLLRVAHVLALILAESLLGPELVDSGDWRGAEGFAMPLGPLIVTASHVVVCWVVAGLSLLFAIRILRREPTLR